MLYSYHLKSKRFKSDVELTNWLQSQFTMIRESVQKGVVHYFDTFDWRLYRQGYHLYLLNQSLYLYRFTKRHVEKKENFQHAFTEILITQDGVIFGKIAQIVENRALLCRASLRINIQSYRLLNKADKMIARVQIEDCKIKNKSKYNDLGIYFEIYPLRGYGKEIPGIQKKFPSGELSACTDDRLKRGLKIIGKMPADYGSKLQIRLTNRMSALEATKKIFIYLLGHIRINEKGILKDIDTEFLHDFRVAIRRSRSALGQFKGILDEKIVHKMKNNFSFIGRSTNKLRDIDVYLLREQQYKLMVPVELKQYLNRFFQDLREQREIEYRSIIELIRSAKYKRILSEWEMYLRSKHVQNFSKMKMAKEMAGSVIERRNKKVLDYGQKILLSGSDDFMHRLRIEGKKLRYLLEFFQSLFPPEKIRLLIDNLKLLQNNLGDIHDLIIQQQRLIDSARELNPEGRIEKNTALTFGILIGKLNEKQLIKKNEFAKLFSNYAAPDVQKIYNEIIYVNKGRVG